MTSKALPSLRRDPASHSRAECSGDFLSETYGWGSELRPWDKSNFNPSQSVPVWKFVIELRDSLKLEARVKTLEATVARLQDELERLRAILIESGRRVRDDSARSEQASDYDPRLADVVLITQEMFPGDAVVEADRDPEDPNNAFVIFNVECQGSAEDIVAKRIEWHKRVSAARPGCSGFLRLSIVPV